MVRMNIGKEKMFAAILSIYSPRIRKRYVSELHISSSLFYNQFFCIRYLKKKEKKKKKKKYGYQVINKQGRVKREGDLIRSYTDDHPSRRSFHSTDRTASPYP